MSDRPDLQERASEVWNRAAGGDPVSRLPGDRALADALRFLGYAEGDGLLSAVEADLEDEEAGPTGSSALLWFGLTDASTLVDEIQRRWVEVVDGNLDPRARAAALGDLEEEADRRFGSLEVEDALQVALGTAVERRPECFAQEAEAAEVPPVASDGPDGQRPGWAVRIPAEEKLRRTAQAYEAFGVRAEVQDGHLVLWPPDTDEGWEMLEELDRLLEHRYPTEDD